MTDFEAAWDAIHDAKPDGWFVGQPSYVEAPQDLGPASDVNCEFPQTEGHPKTTEYQGVASFGTATESNGMSTVARTVALAAVALLLGACDTGGAFMVENKTDQELIARVTGSEQERDASVLAFQPRQDVFALPARSRLSVANQHFKDAFEISKIEILTSDCMPVAVFDEGAGVSFARDGTVITVDPGLAAHLGGGAPVEGTLASTVDRCLDLSQ